MEPADAAAEPAVRHQDFECDGPVELVVELDAGRLDVRLVEADSDGGEDLGLDVSVQADPSRRSPVGAGLGGLLSWLGEQVDPHAGSERDAEAVAETRIEFDGRRLLVLAPKDMPLRAVPLSVAVTAPAKSTVAARTGSADTAVDGIAARLDLSAGAGEVRAQDCPGPIHVRGGSGDVRLGELLGALRARTGSGNLEVSAARGGGRVQTGSGDLKIGVVRSDLTARTGSGDLTIEDATAGELDLTTGSGQLRVGVHSGVLADVDLRTGSGTARSELPVGDRPHEASAGLRVRGRTGSGDAVLTSGLG